MPSSVDSSTARMAAMQTRQLATTASLNAMRSTDYAQQASDLKTEQGRLEATARIFRESQLVGTIVDAIS